MAGDPRALLLINRFAAGGPHLISLPFRDALIEALVIVLNECPDDDRATLIAVATQRLADEREDQEDAWTDDWPEEA